MKDPRRDLSEIVKSIHPYTFRHNFCTASNGQHFTCFWQKMNLCISWEIVDKYNKILFASNRSRNRANIIWMSQFIQSTICCGTLYPHCFWCIFFCPSFHPVFPIRKYEIWAGRVKPSRLISKLPTLSNISVVIDMNIPRNSNQDVVDIVCVSLGDIGRSCDSNDICGSHLHLDSVARILLIKITDINFLSTSM